MQKQYIIDRIEGEFVIIEDDDLQMRTISLKEVKGDPKEGDVLVKDGEFFRVDFELTKLRRDKINSMMKNMWN